ncbi:conjugal transfer protein TraM [Rugamonas rivuli]|uniref:Conjugal transfer protein TraM n=1 Tax=Rugamonas rivuli TaxID=2743358 RepID=A0A843SGU3_9BURK|nr:conjugal transfer protein TraM [Rugamonas rivuli]MQA21678.1 conjugal transfer protein TraM [Rugamonas rivuli]
MADQIEELIREIAAKHGIAVARDDPVLVLQTINNRLLQDSAAAQQAQLDQFKEELEGVSLRWQTDAKDKAERVVNAALAASKCAMDQVLQEGASATSKIFRSELDNALAAVSNHAREAHRAALLNLIASCLTTVAVIAAVWSFK